MTEILMNRFIFRDPPRTAVDREVKHTCRYTYAIRWMDSSYTAAVVFPVPVVCSFTIHTYMLVLYFRAC